MAHKGRLMLHTARSDIGPGRICNATRVRRYATPSGVRVTVLGMKIGYGRVSTRDQNPDAQRDALTAAGCDQVFVDKASGKLARRPELDKTLLSASRAGDQLAVTKLDRLGRSLEHLIALSKGLPAHQRDRGGLQRSVRRSPALSGVSYRILRAHAPQLRAG